MLNNDGPAKKDTDKDVDTDLMKTAQHFLQTCKMQGWKFSSLQEAAVSELYAFI